MNVDNISDLESFWSEQIKLWQSTDLTQRAYCEKNDLPFHRFNYWKRKLTKPTEPVSEAQGFVQLKPMATSRSTNHSCLSLQLPNQLRIEGISSENLYLLKQLTELLQ